MITDMGYCCHRGLLESWVIAGTVVRGCRRGLLLASRVINDVVGYCWHDGSLALYMIAGITVPT
jgi:hypothetical protein